MTEGAQENLLDRLAEKLSETGIPFKVDAWENNPPLHYGVVELTGQNSAEWADGHMIDQAFEVEVTLYLASRSRKWIDSVQDTLETMDAGYSLTRSQWLPDLRKTAYTWRVSFFGPIEWTGSEESEPEQEGAADGQDRVSG